VGLNDYISVFGFQNVPLTGYYIGYFIGFSMELTALLEYLYLLLVAKAK